jgi:hypothetical protein
MPVATAPNPIPGISPTPIPATGRMDRVAAFKPGFWNGKNYTADYLQKLHDNFQKLSTGPDPWYHPFLNINHDDELRYGRIIQSEIDPKDHTLYLYADRIPAPVAEWVRMHQLDDRSIEMFEPKIVNGEKVGFVGPDGKIVDGPVLKCLSLLGSDIPAVKQLGPIPPVKFSQRVPATVIRFSQCRSTPAKFSNPRASMNQELLNQLQQTGFNISTIPADATDDFLKEMLRWCQAMNGNPTPVAQQRQMDDKGIWQQQPDRSVGDGTAVKQFDIQQPDRMDPGATTMADGIVPRHPGHTMSTQYADAANPTGAAPVGGAGVTQPATHDPNGRDLNKITLHFSQQLEALRVQLGQVQTQSTAQLRFQNQALQRQKEGIVRTFCDRMSTAGRITPDMRKRIIEPQLMKCDMTAVRAFADGKTQGTELEETMAAIESSFPVYRSAPNPKDEAGRSLTRHRQIVSVAGDNVTADGVSDRTRKILQGSPTGRAQLKRMAASK